MGMGKSKKRFLNKLFSSKKFKNAIIAVFVLHLLIIIPSIYFYGLEQTIKWIVGYSLGLSGAIILFYIFGRIFGTKISMS